MKVMCGRYVFAYFGGWIYTALLTLPHSIAVNLAWPDLIAKNDNVYGGMEAQPLKKEISGQLFSTGQPLFTPDGINSSVPLLVPAAAQTSEHAVPYLAASLHSQRHLSLRG